jgi:hypothetical protein
MRLEPAVAVEYAPLWQTILLTFLGVMCVIVLGTLLLTDARECLVQWWRSRVQRRGTWR